MYSANKEGRGLVKLNTHRIYWRQVGRWEKKCIAYLRSLYKSHASQGLGYSAKWQNLLRAIKGRIFEEPWLLTS